MYGYCHDLNTSVLSYSTIDNLLTQNTDRETLYIYIYMGHAHKHVRKLVHYGMTVMVSVIV